MSEQLDRVTNQVRRLSSTVDMASNIIRQKHGLVFGQKSQNLEDSIDTLHIDEQNIFDNMINNTLSSMKLKCISALQFSLCDQNNLKTIEMENLSRIESSETFTNCTQLSVVYAPKLSSIEGDKTFYGCSNLRVLDYPFLDRLGKQAITNTGSLEYVNLPKLSSCENFFADMNQNKNILSLILPSLTSYDQAGFAKTQCRYIDIRNVKYIYSNWCSFAFNYNLEKIECSSLTCLPPQCFYQAYGLKDIYVPNVKKQYSLGTYMGYGAFEYCKSLSSVTAPNLTELNDHVFTGCESLLSLELPELTGISRYVFPGCAVEYLNFPKLKYVGALAFCEARNLKYIRIPNAEQFPKATPIGSQSSTAQFIYCNQLSVVDFSDRESDTIPTLAESGSLIFTQTNDYYKILVPPRLLTRWQTYTNWIDISSHIVSSLT